MSTATLKVTTPSDREIAMTRVFAAPRNLVFDALTRPELLKRWEARDAVLKFPMEQGVSFGYDGLAEFLVSTLARGEFK